MKKKKPLKIVLIGDSGCGKTSLILSYIGLPMSDEHTPTAFDDFVTDAVMADGKEVGSINPLYRLCPAVCLLSSGVAHYQ